jgi:hypothetical protein
MDIRERISALCQRADEISARYFEHQGFTYAKPDKHKPDYLSPKWCRIMVLEERNGTYTETSVYCFVCLQDGQTKALGVVKAGDIHKTATAKAPAKHARGSVFQEDFGNCLTPHGIVYLK